MLIKKAVLLLLKIIGVAVALLFIYLFLGWPKTYPKTYGITWSLPYARYLGIDPFKGLADSLDELGVRHVRIPVYWTEVERERGQFDWSSIDRQLDIIAKRQGTVTLVVGAKQPRWPECWLPEWSKSLPADERRHTQLVYARKAIERYAAHPEITRWQVENEPTFLSSFGDCSLYDPSTIHDEIKLVRELGIKPRPIATTASGELSTWLFEPKNLQVGFSVYRTISNRWIKKWSYWFLPSWFYTRKIALRNFLRGGSMYVSEFQMEPWVQGDIRTMSDKEHFYTFDLKQMRSNLVYASRLHVPEIHFWGAEWWYWVKTKKNHPEFWEEMKRVFDTSRDSS